MDSTSHWTEPFLTGDIVKLWIYDTDADDAVIEAGCAAAVKMIESRGFAVEAAYQSVLARSNRESFNRQAAKAWDDSEDEALRVAFGEEDDWPDGAVLGPAQ